MIHLLDTVALLAASSSKKSTSSSGSYTFLLFLVVIGVALYFLFLRPQQQRTKRQREVNSAIAEGDEVLTVGGMVGRVVEMHDDRVTIEAGGPNGTRLVFLRSAISRKLTEQQTGGRQEHPEFELQRADGKAVSEPEEPAQGEPTVSGSTASGGTTKGAKASGQPSSGEAANDDPDEGLPGNGSEPQTGARPAGGRRRRRGNNGGGRS